MSSPEQLESYYNNVLGMPFSKKAGESIDPLKLMDRKYKFTKLEDDTIYIPKEILLVTCAVDVQRGRQMETGRLEVEFWGWGMNEESYLLFKTKIFGNPREREVYSKLEQLLQARFIREDKVEISISRIFLDSGYATQNIYEFCAAKHYYGYFAIKGSTNSLAPVLPRTATYVNNEQTMLLEIGVNEIKDILYKRTAIDKPGAGYIHFNEDYCNADYFEQFTSEHSIVKVNKAGFMYLHYEKKDNGKANEALDLAVYNYAAMKHALPDGNWERLKLVADKISAQTKIEVDKKIEHKTPMATSGRKKLRRH
jgi:phage terminase large subunit GpA-like protein